MVPSVLGDTTRVLQPLMHLQWGDTQVWLGLGSTLPAHRQGLCLLGCRRTQPPPLAQPWRESQGGLLGREYLPEKEES